LVGKGAARLGSRVADHLEAAACQTRATGEEGMSADAPLRSRLVIRVARVLDPGETSLRRMR